MLRSGPTVNVQSQHTPHTSVATAICLPVGLVPTAPLAIMQLHYLYISDTYNTDVLLLEEVLHPRDLADSFEKQFKDKIKCHRQWILPHHQNL